MSPEGILDNIYGPKTDVWAFGIMIYEIYHGRTPFNYCQTEEELRASVTKQLQWSNLKNDINNEAKELILNCLEVREDKRPTIQHLANNAFLLRVVHNRDIQITS
jgi:serine/threonine protein kinase